MDRIELIDSFRLAIENGERMPDHLVLPRWTPDHWRQIAAICEPLSVEAGEALITSGNTERALYFVIEGSVEVAFVIRQSLTVSIMSHVGVGSLVGEQSFFDSAPRSANVWAVDNCVLLKLDLRDFERFSESNPRLGYDFVFALGRILAQRLRSTTAKVSQ